MSLPDIAMHAVHHDFDIRPIPEQVLYINEPDRTGDFCGRGISDLDDAQWLVKPKCDYFATIQSFVIICSFLFFI